MRAQEKAVQKEFVIPHFGPTEGNEEQYDRYRKKKEQQAVIKEHLEHQMSAKSDKHRKIKQKSIEMEQLEL